MLATTSRALLESLIGFGLTLSDAAAGEEDARQIDNRALNPTARRVTGAGYTARREILCSLAYLRSTRKRYLLKTASVLDCTLRAKGTQAQNGPPHHLEECVHKMDTWRPGSGFTVLRTEQLGVTHLFIKNSGETQQGKKLINLRRK